MKKIISFSILIIISVTIILLTYLYFKFNITFLDTPKKLSKNQETISVTYINWACDCADFIKTNEELYLNDGSIDKNKLFFLEGEKDKLNLKLSEYIDSNRKKSLKVTGSFYEDLGIPKNYELKTPEKPEKALVFKFHKIEY